MSEQGAVLSQRSSLNLKLHPCAFSSHHLNDTERNYEMENRELLEVKIVLKERRHWLERVEHLFIVYGISRTTKRLYSRKARWALLFTRFNFSLSYRPGTKNVKPDSLSRRYSPTATTPELETIHPTLDGMHHPQHSAGE